LLAAILMGTTVNAAQLNPEKWIISDSTGKKVTQITDNNLETAWVSSDSQKEGLSLTLDLGREMTIHRVFLTPGRRISAFPRSLRLSMGSDDSHLSTFLEKSLPDIVENDFTFNPVTGRFFRIEIGKDGSGYPWSIAELNLDGFEASGGVETKDAVVLPDGMPDFVKLSAQDLAYYAGEITGHPVSVIKPEEAQKYTGTLFVVDAPVAGTYDPKDFLRRDMETVNVFRQNREIHFAGQTPRAVMYGIFEFLDRQGVRWLFPWGNGDCILRHGELDLSVLPLKYAPPFVIRFFQGSIDDYYRPQGKAQRWFARIHLNKSWNSDFDDKVLGGYACREICHHTFSSLIPTTLYKEHPEWFPMFIDKKWEAKLQQKGYRLGQRVPYGIVGDSFCTSSRDAREYIVSNVVEKAKKAPAFHSLRIGQMDSDHWCECPECRAQDKNSPQLKRWDYMEPCMSDRYYDLVLYLDKRLKELLPGRTIQIAAWNYSECRYPPTFCEKLPENVSVDILPMGLYTYLPPTASCNKDCVAVLEQWHKVAGHLGFYTWDLLACKYKIPIASVTSLSEWFRYLKSVNCETMEPEASVDIESFRGNPWYYYAYGRLMWNPDEPAEKILNEFFQGYYQEASEPMLAYYKTLESHIRSNNLMYGPSSYQIQALPEMFTPEIVVSSRSLLDKADAKAKSWNWSVKSRIADAHEGLELAVRKINGIPSSDQWIREDKRLSRQLFPGSGSWSFQADISPHNLKPGWECANDRIPLCSYCGGWFHQGFFNIQINGDSLSHHIPEITTWSGLDCLKQGFEPFRALLPPDKNPFYYKRITLRWKTTDANVELVVLLPLNEKYFLIEARIEPLREIKTVESSFLCFPSNMAEPFDRWVKTSLANLNDRKFITLDPIKEFSIIYYDSQWDKASKPHSGGPCALIFPPGQAQTVEVDNRANCAIGTRLAYSPSTRVLRYVVIPSLNVPNQEAFEWMQSINGKITSAK
jgi:hypothetical protein